MEQNLLGDMKKKEKDEKGFTWIFPLLLLVILTILVSLRVSGSSAANYHYIFYGTLQDDRNLILGEPRAIRSDEWLVQTPWMISQALSRSTGINQNIGNGLNFSVQNIPVFNWTLIFRPLFWGFYVLPLEYAFSLYWWGKAFGLLMVSYFLALKFLNGKVLPSALLSIGFLFSSFFQWWYSTTAIDLVIYAGMALLLLFAIVDHKLSIETPFLFTGVIFAVFAMFLLLYPAFQIPIIYVLAFSLIGYLFQQKFFTKDSQAGLKGMFLFLSLIIVGTLCLLFYKNNQSTFDIVRNTVYPGQRMALGGGKSFLSFLTGFYDHQLLQNGERLLPGMSNQCEAASFPFLSLVIAPWLCIELMYSYFSNKKANPLLSLLLLAELLFMAWSTMVFPVWFAKYSLLSLVPSTRGLIGMGWLNYIILCVLLGSYYKKEPLASIFQISFVSICVIGFVALGFYFRSLNIEYIGSRKLIVIIAIFIGLMIYFILKKQALFFSICFFLFAIWTSFTVNPVYRGLSPYFEPEITKVIKERNIIPNQKWVVFDNIILANLILANGGNIYNGTFFYPDFSYITKFDSDQEFSSVYNRYSHILFSPNSYDEKPKFDLIQGDVYSIKINPCNSTFDAIGINNFVFTKTVSFPCLKKYAEIHKPNLNLYFYSNDLER